MGADAERNGVYPNPGSIVEVKFVLNSRGEISKMIHVNPSAGTSDAATRACPAAIEPGRRRRLDRYYRQLESEQEMTFTFLYQRAIPGKASGLRFRWDAGWSSSKAFRRCGGIGKACW